VPRSTALLGLAALYATTEGHVKSDADVEVYLSILPPHKVMWASEAWMRFCGFEAEELLDNTLGLIQGPETDEETVAGLMDAVGQRQRCSVTLVNYTKHGVPFRHTITCEPLCNSFGVPVVYKAASHDICLLLEHTEGLLLPGGSPLAAMMGHDQDKYESAEEEDVE